MQPAASKANFSEHPIDDDDDDDDNDDGWNHGSTRGITLGRISLAANFTVEKKKETTGAIALCRGDLHSMHDPLLNLTEKFPSR